MRLLLISLAATLAVVALPALLVAQQKNEGMGVLRMAGERFAPVTLRAGQGARVLVANVLVPEADASPDPCPVLIRFFSGDGNLLGSTDVSLPPGASRSVVAKARPGVIRAIVSVKDLADPDKICAVKATLELFNAGTGATLLIVASELCLGNGDCNVTLPAPRGQ